MHEEPYRWLEAIQNRREYIVDQIKEGTPVFALSRPEGVLLLGVGSGQSKIFEIFDRHGLAALGNPVDIEKLRQTAIEAAHTEGFNRSSDDVTLRRLVSFSLSPALKNSFEQIFSPPNMVESILAEVGPTPSKDAIVRLRFDGNHEYSSSGIAVASPVWGTESIAAEWLRETINKGDKLGDVISLCLTAWKALNDDNLNDGLKVPKKKVLNVPGKTVEAVLLDRKPKGNVHYRSLDTSDL